MGLVKVIDEIKIPENQIELAIKKTLKGMNNHLELPVLYTEDGRIYYEREINDKVGLFDLTYSKVKLETTNEGCPLSKRIKDFKYWKRYSHSLCIEYKTDKYVLFGKMEFDAIGGIDSDINQIKGNEKFVPFVEHFNKDFEGKSKIKDIKRASKLFSKALLYINDFGKEENKLSAMSFFKRCGHISPDLSSPKKKK